MTEPLRVISISRRTDIPAFYTEWLVNRVRSGFCDWMNPFGGQIYRVSLQPEDCLALVFWTRNARPLIPHLADLRARGFQFYFQYTINGHPREIDANSPSPEASVAAFRELAQIMTPNLVMWRYDPVLISRVTPPEYHVERFDELSAALEGATERCYVSFLDVYGKTQRNLRRVNEKLGLDMRRPEADEQRALLAAFAEIAGTRGMTVHVCCDEAEPGLDVHQAHCIDADVIRRLRPDAHARLKSVSSRPRCGCAQAVDIGAYDTCTFGCVYCYATNSRNAALQRRRSHDPNDTILWRPSTLRGVDLGTREQRPNQLGKKRDRASSSPTLFDETRDRSQS
ncbi:MAG: DUF1848 domain-containing protein [Actinobacteria bacterium]|nr:DUF1848 domain-containing protein [Actinomycetota bacterium]